MEHTNRFNSKLKEMCQSNDYNGIISTLIEIRRAMQRNKNFINLDRNSFQLVLNLIKIPNPKILDYSMSIIANCCLHKNYRDMFNQLEGIPHLILALKTIDNDSINCRTCRLIGNLSADANLAVSLHKYNTGFILVKSLEKHENMSLDTLMMTFRAIRKLWEVKEYRSKMLPSDVSVIMLSCLNSKEEEVVKLTAETLSLFSAFKSPQKNVLFEVNKELLLRLVELFKKEDLKPLVITCLSNLICYHKAQIWPHLEGSNIPDIFIEHFKCVDNIDNVLYYTAFYHLCTEGNMRMKIRGAELLPKLLQKCHGGNTSKILAILSLFQYDKQSIGVLSRLKCFVPTLIQNIKSPDALILLEVVSRLEPPVMELVKDENLDVFIENKECSTILKKITGTQKFLRSLIVSGKIWRICKAGCSMEDIGSTGYAEGLIVHLLSSGDKKQRENASLAIPFLVKARDFKVLYRLLAHYQAITNILHLLEEYPTDEGTLASIVRLMDIFQVNHANNYDESSDFFQNENNFKNEESESDFDDGVAENTKKNETNVSRDEMITFQLDSGVCATVNKSLLCKNSPVLDAMLNGHFIESSQQRVKLSCCSRDAIITLARILNNEMKMTEITSPDTYLELISLTDRFLISDLNNILTANLIIDKSSCSAIYQWCHTAGDTKNNSIIRKKIYKFLFSSSEYLIIAMKNDTFRPSLISEISNYLSNSLKDLL